MPECIAPPGWSPPWQSLAAAAARAGAETEVGQH